MIVPLNGKNYLLIESTILVDSTFSFKYYTSRQRSADGTLITTSLADYPLVNAALKFFEDSNYFTYLKNNVSQNVRVDTIIEFPLINFSGNLLQSDFIIVSSTALKYFEIGDIISIDGVIRKVTALSKTIVSFQYDEFNEIIYEEDGITPKTTTSTYTGLEIDEPVNSCESIMKCVIGFIDGDIEYSTTYNHTTFEFDFKSEDSFFIPDTVSGVKDTSGVPIYPFALIRDNGSMTLAIRQDQIIGSSAFAKRKSFALNSKKIHAFQITSNIDVYTESLTLLEFMNIVKGSGRPFIVDIGYGSIQNVQAIADDSFDIVFKSPNICQLALNAEEV